MVLAEGLVYKVHNKIPGPQLVIIVELGSWQGQNWKYLKAKGFGGETENKKKKKKKKMYADVVYVHVQTCVRDMLFGLL